MHHIHTTEAFVLSSFPIKESEKILNLLTKDFGVIRVTAQGIRKIESKLRNSVQDFSLTFVSMVYGKQGWRLINAELLENFFTENNSKNQTIAKIFSLIERMIPFEEINEDIFELVKKQIKKILIQPESEIYLLEIQLVFELMRSLGYVGDSFKIDLSKIINDLHYVKQKETEIIKIINNAIIESHL